MEFHNEKVSEVDIENYGLREINRQANKADSSYYWTINDEKNIYFRYLGYHPQVPDDVQYSYFWRGSLFDMRACSKSEGVRDGKGVTKWEQVLLIPLNQEAKAEFASSKDVIYADLKQALTAFKDFGVFSAIADHTAHFNF